MPIFRSGRDIVVCQRVNYQLFQYIGVPIGVPFRSDHLDLVKWWEWKNRSQLEQIKLLYLFFKINHLIDRNWHLAAFKWQLISALVTIRWQFGRKLACPPCHARNPDTVASGRAGLRVVTDWNCSSALFVLVASTSACCCACRWKLNYSSFCRHQIVAIANSNKTVFLFSFQSIYAFGRIRDDHHQCHHKSSLSCWSIKYN